MFFGVVGGVMAFGFLGIFLGPTLLALGYVLM
jgi:predicted PurR-regulated permease PerM